MARNRATAKKAGTAAETAVANYLARVLADDRIERRAKTGATDRGDIGGVRHMGGRVVIEVKNVTTLALAQWVGEAITEAGNDDAICGLVIHKKRGTTNPADWYVTTTVNELVGLLTGQYPTR